MAGSAEPLRVAAGQDKDIRVAVVIGNSRYPAAALENPKNDATAMAASLRKLGFDVELKLDATKADMDAVFKRLAGKAEKATVAALFYAGHGIQVNGSNYIVPIDAKPQSERDLKREMVRMDDVIDDMGAARVKLVFFDACRDNPLSRSFGRGSSRGMAAPVEATGTLISFATKHGNTAADGDGRHSPYTTALLAALENPAGVEIEQMLRKVQQGVKQATNGQQEPWRYGSLDASFYFKTADPVAETGRQAAADAALLEAMRRENERAAKERGELQQALKSQLEASTEAMKRSTEQAARERAELQQSMEKMLKDALARQTAAMEAERQARQSPGETVKAQAAAPPAAEPVASPQAATIQPIARPAPQAAPAVAKAAAPAPTQIAMIAPGRPAEAASPASTSAFPQVGDSWTYRYVSGWKTDQPQTVVVRVEESAGGRVTDKMSLQGGRGVRGVDERSFEGKPEAAERPLGRDVRVIELLPYVQSLLQEGLKPGQEKSFPDIVVNAQIFRIKTRLGGQEKITVPAGTFDAVRVSVVGQGAAPSTGGEPGGGGSTVPYTFSHVVWFVPEIRRIVKAEHRSANAYGRRVDDDTLELVSFETGAVQLVAPVSAAPVSPVSQQGPIQLATIAPASPAAAPGPSQQALDALANVPGDEWEYLATDEMFGKKQKLVLRVKAATADGVLEDIVWNGKHLMDWVFGSRAAAIGTPSESEFMFAPHWDGSEISDFMVEGGRSFCTVAKQSCRMSLKVSGTEKLTIAAGTFDAVRLDGWINLNRGEYSGDGRLTVWYSRDQRRLLKQRAELSTAGLAGIPQFRETLELTAIRRAPR